MEIAIPIVVLGGMYVLSNQDAKDKETAQSKEGFIADRTTPKVQYDALPNTNTPIINFPVGEPSEVKQNPNYYPIQMPLLTNIFINPNMRKRQRKTRIVINL